MFKEGNQLFVVGAMLVSEHPSGHLMGLCDPVVLGTARKSLASCLDIEVLTLT